MLSQKDPEVQVAYAIRPDVGSFGLKSWSPWHPIRTLASMLGNLSTLASPRKSTR